MAPRTSWLEDLKQLTNKRLNRLIGNKESLQTEKRILNYNEEDLLFLENKQNQLKSRKSQIVKVTANGQIISLRKVDNQRFIEYILHHQFLIKQPNDKFYIEENLVPRQAIISDNQIVKDRIIEKAPYQRLDHKENERPIRLEDITDTTETRQKYHYNRRAAVQYAERWWNSYNPKYRKFENDCTNFISQCLHEGGIPMAGFGNRNKGWWYSGNTWSYSWAVAHAFRWYLSGAKQGIKAQEVPSASDLILGDVICYDFEGDGRWNHNTIVVAKDANNQPLVNAHTYNSRMRYWAYEDSTAYTPNIKYKFFHILDRE